MSRAMGPAPGHAREGVSCVQAVARGGGGVPLVSKETVVLISLNKRVAEGAAAKPSNVIIRGLSPVGLQLRPQVRLVAGRFPIR